jgi:glutamine synthetase adenylyltransferase
MSATVRRPTPGDLVGRDFARVRAPGRLSARRIAWLVGIAFACALALAALRIDILRVRYALGEAIREEKALVQQQRQQIAVLEGLRNPSRLVEVAQRLGFAPPERVIDLRASLRNGAGNRQGGSRPR